jgi:hypothetical protein
MCGATDMGWPDLLVSGAMMKIGPPHIILVSDFYGLLGEHPQIHPRNSFFFQSYPEKAKNIRVHSLP